MSRAQELVDRPGESLSVELKQWIDPDSPEGIAKIARSTLALRNFGGGYLVIGFVDDTLEPDTTNVPSDVRSAFHIDKIQGLVSRYASEPFEIAVSFPSRREQLYPVIEIPSGVKTPVAAKADLIHNGHKLIAADDVYVRTLRSNNTPSTSKAGWKDWPKVVEVCFDNREADIGRFFRRHISGVGSTSLQELLAELMQRSEPLPTAEDFSKELLQQGEARFLAALAQRKINLPQHGAWEVALVVSGAIGEYGANRDFLNLLDSTNPGYTGWPVWLDSRSFSDSQSRPYVLDGGWEALIVSLDSGWSNHIDFERFDPKGRFYLRRALQDDISGTKHAPTPMIAMDFALQVLRVAEALAVGTAFAKAMSTDPEKTVATFSIRWTRLKDRQLDSWANPERYVSPGRRAHQDEVVSTITIPADIATSSLDVYVSKALAPLFEVFDGFVLGQAVYEDLTKRLIERRL
ncbi:ATP-binding protein [Polaromonas sp. YR568]|uniref:AlbA family DNA-binding domain-containing protein n=1 Tax=Polaromonas sp. YR568 TaxID=1855301 RepID=UPI0031379453